MTIVGGHRFVVDPVVFDLLVSILKYCHLTSVTSLPSYPLVVRNLYTEISDSHSSLIHEYTDICVCIK